MSVFRSCFIIFFYFSSFYYYFYIYIFSLLLVLDCDFSIMRADVRRTCGLPCLRAPPFAFGPQRLPADEAGSDHRHDVYARGFDPPTLGGARLQVRQHGHGRERPDPGSRDVHPHDAPGEWVVVVLVLVLVLGVVLVVVLVVLVLVFVLVVVLVDALADVFCERGIVTLW